jgi:hypothetical protein
MPACAGMTMEGQSLPQRISLKPHPAERAQRAPRRMLGNAKTEQIQVSFETSLRLSSG